MSCTVLPSPPLSLSDFEAMDRNQQQSQRLPPIAMQLGNYLPRLRPNTPPVSPGGSRSAEPASLKRRWSGSEDATEALAQPAAKRLASEAPGHHSVAATRDSIAHSAGQAAQESLDGPRNTSVSSTGHRSSTYGLASQHQSAVTSAPFGRERPSLEIPSQPQTSKAVSANSDVDSGYASQYSMRSRALPPLITPRSPRHGENCLDFKFSASGTAYRSPIYPATTRSDPFLRKASQDESTSTSRSNPHSPHSTRAPDSNERQFLLEKMAPRVSDSWKPGESGHGLPPVRTLSESGGSLSTQPKPSALALAKPSPEQDDQYRYEGAVGDHPARRRRGNLPKEATATLNDWFAQHATYPYPKEEEKQTLQEQTGLTLSQIGNWFINARRRRRPSTTARPVDPHSGHVIHGQPPLHVQHQHLPPHPHQHQHPHPHAHAQHPQHQQMHGPPPPQHQLAPSAGPHGHHERPGPAYEYSASRLPPPPGYGR